MGVKIWDLLLEDSRQWSTVVMRVNSDKFEQETLLYAKKSIPQEKKENNKIVHIKESSDTWVSLLKTLFSEELKIPPEKLGEHEDFAQLGVDSIILAELVKKIEKRFDIILEPSVFWEYPSINAMAGYLNNICAENPEFSKAEASTEFVEEACCSLEEYTDENLSGASPKKIAVVGVSCRFPGAENKDEFWSNLKSGKDSITEIPPIDGT
nr:acyl carrier protein [Ruminiclostridium josui]